MEGKHTEPNIIRKAKSIMHTNLPYAKINVTIQKPNANWIVKNCLVGGKEDNNNDFG